jgi:hypothetical protein
VRRKEALFLPIVRRINLMPQRVLGVLYVVQFCWFPHC